MTKQILQKPEGSLSREVHVEDGWMVMPDEPFDNLIGPIYHRSESDGDILCRMQTAGKNGNGLGIIHGGCLASLADYCLFQVARNYANSDRVVTLSLNCEFTGTGRPDEEIIARGKLTRGGRSVLFAKGEITGRNGVLLSFSGVYKILK